MSSIPDRGFRFLLAPFAHYFRLLLKVIALGLQVRFRSPFNRCFWLVFVFLHYIVFKVRLPPWLFVSRDSLYILTNLSPFVNAFYKKSLTFLSDFLDIGFFACFTEHLHIRDLRVIIMLICFTEALDVRTACGGI